MSMKQVTQALMEWLRQAPGLEKLDNELICDAPGSLALTLNSVKKLEQVRDILGEIYFKAELEYSLRLVLPMERECPAGVQENRAALDKTTAWVCARGGAELPDSLGREARVVMGYPRLEEQREGVGIYSASVLLTTTFELEEDEWN